jgi:alcohol dehydrogenase class IV
VAVGPGVTGPTFSFATADRILFGAGQVEAVPGAVAALGDRCLVVTGRHPRRHAALLDQLRAAGTELTLHPVGREPTVPDARAAAEAAHSHDVVLGIGGGSVLDLAKAAGALVAGDDPMEHLEVVGAGRPLPGPGRPVVAVPTTAGTGSEVTANAVLTAVEQQVKVSLRGPTVLPRLAIVDPLLTLGNPPEVTASSGLDALTQCLEPFVSVLANPLTDGFARTGLKAAGRSLRRAHENGDDVAARTDMALCSLLGGLALANAKLGAVHGFAGILGGLTGAPHGALCAAMLPAVVHTTIAALRDRDPGSLALARYAEAAVLLTGRLDAGLEHLLEWVTETTSLLGVASLSAYGLSTADTATVVQGVRRASSTKGHPIELHDDELAAAYTAAL